MVKKSGATPRQFPALGNAHQEKVKKYMETNKENGATEKI
jgi:hypothetical protein